jgi:hypothetical protein
MNQIRKLIPELLYLTSSDAPLLTTVSIYSTVCTDNEMRLNELRAPGKDQDTATQTLTTSQVKEGKAC